MARSADDHRYRIVLARPSGPLRSVLDLALQSSEDFAVVAEPMTGHDAIDAVRWCHSDAIVLGVLLPGVNALRLLPLIRTMAPDATVMVLAVEPTARFVHVVKARGADLCEQSDTPPPLLLQRLLAQLEPATI